MIQAKFIVEEQLSLHAATDLPWFARLGFGFVRTLVVYFCPVPYLPIPNKFDQTKRNTTCILERCSTSPHIHKT
jgi:hypothetical protein